MPVASPSPFTGNARTYAEAEAACARQKKVLARLDDDRDKTLFDTPLAVWIALQKTEDFANSGSKTPKSCTVLERDEEIKAKLKWTQGDPRVSKIWMEKFSFTSCNARCIILVFSLFTKSLRDINCEDGTRSFSAFCKGKIQSYCQIRMQLLTRRTNEVSREGTGNVVVKYLLHRSHVWDLHWRGYHQKIRQTKAMEERRAKSATMELHSVN